MPTEIGGLPLHPLIVHATVVIVPLAALLVIASALSTRVRAWAGPLPMLVSLAGLVLTPLSTSSGENLEEQVAVTELVREHAELGDQLLIFTGLLFVFALAHWLVRRRPGVAKVWVASVAVLAVLAGVGTMVQVVRIGHSGAKAAWSDTSGS
ncbi:hypothetical protein BH09ACT11_BH09ACT11_05490 [soil metagenome]